MKNPSWGSLMAALILTCALQSRAASDWNVDASGNWSNGANWTSNPQAPGLLAGDVVNLTFNITAARTVTIDTLSRTLGTLTIGDSGSSYFGYTLTNSEGAILTFNDNGSTANLVELTTSASNIIGVPITLSDNLSISNDFTLSGGGLYFSGAISGSKSITKLGTGQLTFDATNTYTGGTIISGGRIRSLNPKTFGTGAITINSSGQVWPAASGAFITNAVSIAGNGWVETAGELGAIRLNGPSIFGPITLTADARITAYNSSGTIAGNIGESGGARKLELGGSNLDATGGTITLSGTNTHSGGTDVRGAIVNANTSTAFGTGAITIDEGASNSFTTKIYLASGITITNQITCDSTADTASEGVITANGGGTSTLTGTIIISAGPASGAHFASVNSGSVIRLMGPINVIGNRTPTLRRGTGEIGGGGNYGRFDIGQGTLRLATNNGLNTAARLNIGVSAAGVFDMNGFNQTLTELTCAGSFAANAFNNGVSASVVTLDVPNATNTTCAVNLQDGTGVLSLVKQGSGTLNLSGTNTYTGGTTVNAGTLSLGSSNVLADTGGLIMNGGTFSNAGFSDTVGALTNQSSSTIVLGTNASGTLTFASGSYVAGTLTISNWAGTAGASGAGTANRIFITAAPSATFLTNINFVGYEPGAIRLGAGEIVPSAALPTKLAISSVNSGSNPTAGTGFGVIVQSQDAGGTPQNVTADTTVTLSLNTGSGTLGGTLTGTITAGTNSVSISGVTYNKAESGVIITATRTSGDTLTAGNSSPFTVNNANGNWNVDAAGNWSAAANWSSNPIVPGNAPGDIVGLIFNITAARIITMDTTSRTVGTLNIGDSGSSYFGYTLAASGGATLTFNNNGSTANLVQSNTTATDTISLPITLADDLNVSNVSTLTLSGNIGGGKSITKSGIGTVTLSGSNSYNGLTVSSGTIRSATTNSSRGTITLADTSTGTNNVSWLFAGGTTPTNPIVVAASGSGTVTIGTYSGGIFTTHSGTLTLNRPVTFSDATGDRSTFNGKISGKVGTITITGPRVTFGGTANDFTGNILINSGSIYQNDSATSLPTNTSVTVTGLFRLNNGGTHTIDGLTGNGPVSIIAGGVATLSIGNAGGSSTFGGVIQNGAAVLTLAKAGAGTLTLTATNTYSGTTTVSNGTLVINGVLSTNTTTVKSGATLMGAGTIDGAVTVQSGATLQPGTNATHTGSLTISNTLNLAGTTLFALNRTNAQNSSRLAGITTATYGGTLTVSNLGPALVAGDTFTLFSATSYSGTFSSTNLPSLTTGLVWNTSQLSVNGSISVEKSNQTITFGSLANKTYGNPTFGVSATASSGLTVTFSILSGPATISGGTYVTITGVGAVTVRASQPGDANYNAAPNVDRSFNVSQATLTVTSDNTNRTYGATNPVFTGSIVGLQYSDNITATYSTSATTNSAPGSYTISQALNDPDLKQGNYTVTTNNGSLLVTAAARLSIQTQPSATATAGVAFAQQPVIRVEDQFGNLMACDNTTEVTATRDAGSGILQGTTTATAVNGIATFTNLSHNVAANITIDFSASGLAGVTSDAITISGAPAAQLTFVQQPVSTIAGKVFSTQPVVRALDAYGNFSSNLPANLEMTISMSGGSGLMFGQKTFDIGGASGNGTVTFTNLEINAAGNKQLTASASGLSNAVSEVFTNVGTVQRYLLAGDYSVGSAPGSISLGNLRGEDNWRDIAVVNYSNNTVSVRECDDAGAFGEENVLGAGLHPSALLTADFNRDGFEDIAVANYGTNTINILLNLMNGDYTPAKAFTIGAGTNPGPIAMTTADLNHDGRHDIIVANELEKSVSVLLSLGGGSFASPVNYSVGASVGSVRVVDVDGDHIDDILIANPDEGTATYLPGLTNGGFGAPHTLSLFPAGNPRPKVIIPADLNRDGLLDLVTVNYASNSVTIFTNAGGATYSRCSEYEVGTKPCAVVVRDLDADGRHDLAVVNSGSGTVDILISRGDGTFFSGGTVPVGAGPTAIAGSNFNDDTATDLTVVNTDANTVSALLYSAPMALSQHVAVREDVPQAITLTYRSLLPMNVDYAVVDQPTNGTLSGTAPNLIYTPATNFNGADSFTFNVSAGGITSEVSRVSLTIVAVNDAPEFVLATNQIFVAEDAGPQTVVDMATNFSKGPDDEAGQILSFSVTTANPKFFSIAPKISTNGVLTFCVATNVSGTNFLTVVLRDSGGTNNGSINQSSPKTLAIVVMPVGDAPIFKTISLKTVLEDASTNFDFVVTDVDTLASDLTVSASSSNTALISNEHLVVTRSGTNWNLAITPEPNAVGSVVISLVADDGAKRTTNKFNLTITPVNDAPSFTIPVQTATVTEDAPLQTFANFVTDISRGPADETSQSVSFIITVTNTAFFITRPVISPTGTLTFRPAVNVTGTNFFSVRIKDSGGAANGGTNQSPAQSFCIVVLRDRVKLVNGSYNSLFYETNEVHHHSSGSANFTIGSQRVFSGRMLIEGGTYSFSGQFDTNGGTFIHIPRSGKSTLAMSMQLNLENANGEVSGTITDGNWIAGLSGGRTATNLVNLAAGKYSVALAGNRDGITGPGGDGIGVATLSSTGNLGFSGTLSDTTAISQATKVCRNGQWPFYVSLYGGRGLLLGWITLTNQIDSKFTGAVSWIKTNAYGLFYTNGFTNEMSAVGSTVSLTTSPLLNLGNGIIVLDGADLSAPLTNTFSFSTNSVISVTSTNNRLGLTLTKTTGLLSGSFVHPITHRTTSVKGILMQDQNVARGFFYTTNQSGYFSLESNH